MPFPNQDPWPYTRDGIQRLDPNQPGIYGIYRSNPGGVWIYVGQAKDIRARLLQHFAGDNPCINRSGPTHFVGEIVHGGEHARLRRERELIEELNPICNIA